jgi:hypothetical protein
MSEQNQEAKQSYPRPAKWRAPTWSWASTLAPVTYSTLGYLWESGDASCLDCTFATYVKNVAVEYVPETDDPTMRLSSAQLTLEGLMSPPMLTFDSKGKLSEIHLGQSQEGLDQLPVPKFFPDYDFSLESQYQIKDVTLQSLLMAEVRLPSFEGRLNDITFYIYLVVRCLDEEKRVYERVGILERDFLQDPRTVGDVRITLV